MSTYLTRQVIDQNNTAAVVAATTTTAIAISSVHLVVTSFECYTCSYLQITRLKAALK